MDTIRTILANIIDEQGTEYLQKSPYAVYQKLISEKARPEYARLVLITLLCNVSVKAGEMDEAELSKDLQNGCFLRKKAADEIAAMYKSLFSEENVSRWKKKEYSGFKEFCDCTGEFEWEGSGKWSRGGGYYDCWCTVLADVKVADRALAEKVVYTGPIDAYFGYSLGTLEYRSVRFETELLDTPNFQGNAAVNYTDRETPWTRIIEHKWFEFGKDAEGNDLPGTVISREYSSEWKPGDEPY